MKLTLAMLSAVTMAGLAVPAHADTASDDAAFLASLRQAGITYTNPDQAIAAAKAVCGLVANGESGLQVLKDLKSTNPGFTTDGAAQFAGIAANAYCPQQLAPVSAK